MSSELIRSDCVHGFTLCVCSLNADTVATENIAPNLCSQETLEEVLFVDEQLIDLDKCLDVNRTDVVTSCTISTEGSFLCEDPAGTIEAVIKLPSPINCSLCLSEIQPRAISYMKIVCYGDCSFSCHRHCYFDAMENQGLHRKKDYKDGVCPTDGCRNRVLFVHEVGLEEEVSLYYKDSEAKIKKVQTVTRKDKRRDFGLLGKKSHGLKKKDLLGLASESESLNCADTFEDLREPELSENGACTKIRSTPLPVHIPVVHLEKKVNQIEEKYAPSSSTTPYRKNLRRQKKNPNLNITEVLMISKRDDYRPDPYVHSNEEGIANQSEWEWPEEVFATESSRHFTGVLANSCTKLEPYLPDLVLNTIPSTEQDYFPSCDLKDAILCVGCDILSQDEKSAIEALFLCDFFTIREFVDELRYFTCINDKSQVKIGKNDLGKILEMKRSTIMLECHNDDSFGSVANDSSSDVPQMQPEVDEIVKSIIDKKKKLAERFKSQAAIASEQHTNRLLQLKLQKLNLLVDVRRQEQSDDISQHYSHIGSGFTRNNFMENVSPHPSEFYSSGDSVPNGEGVSNRSSDYNYCEIGDSISYDNWNSQMNEDQSDQYFIPHEKHQNALDHIDRLEFEMQGADMDRKKVERENNRLRRELEALKCKLHSTEERCGDSQTHLSTLTSEAKIMKVQIEQVVSRNDKTRLYALMLECEKRLTYIASAVAHSEMILKGIHDLEEVNFIDKVKSCLFANLNKWKEMEQVFINCKALIADGRIIALPTIADVPRLPDALYEFVAHAFKYSAYPYKKIASELVEAFKSALSNHAHFSNKEVPSVDTIHSFIVQSLQIHPRDTPDVALILDEFAVKHGWIRPGLIGMPSSLNGINRTTWKTPEGCNSLREVDLSEHECLICYDSLVCEMDGILNCPACKEPFHSKCVTVWLSQAAACPKCRFHWPDPKDFPTLK